MNKRNYTIMTNSASKRKKRLLNDYNINRSILLKKNSKIKLQTAPASKRKEETRLPLLEKERKEKTYRVEKNH